MIRDNAESWAEKFGIEGSEYIVRVQKDNGQGGIQCYIRPNNRNGDTYDFILLGNEILKL